MEAEQLNNPDGSTPTTANAGDKKRAPKGRAGWENAVREQLNGMWAIVAMPLAALNPVDCAIFTQRAPKITEALIHLAQQKPAFKRFLLKSSESMAYTEIVIAVLPIVVLVLANHNPKQFGLFAIPFGGVPKVNEDGSATSSAFNIFDLFSAGVAAGGTPDVNRPDREREDDDSAEFA